MKLAHVLVDGKPRWGVVGETSVRVLDGPSPFAAPKGAVADLATAPGRDVPCGEVELLPPLEVASKVLCVGLNYIDHIREMGRDVPQRPVVFTRFPDSFVAHDDAIEIPRVSAHLDWEGELAVVIGATGRYIAPEDAMRHVLGYTLLNDGSVRDYQRHSHQFAPGKNFPRSGSIGPFVVLAGAVPDVLTGELTTTINGEVVQRSSLTNLLFDIPALVSYCSEWTRLRPGDVIATGTPGGVGDSFDPSRWLTPGDEVIVSVDGLPSLRNTVTDETNGLTHD